MMSAPRFDALDSVDLANRMPLATRLLLRLFGRRLNRDLVSPVLSRAYERRVIDSAALHTIAQQFDPTQLGVVGLVRR